MYDLDQTWKSPKWHCEANVIPEPLYYSIMGGLFDISEWLLTQGAEVNAQGGRYGNALQAASALGYDPVVRLLLDRGAEVNAQGGAYENPVQAASYFGHISVLKLLLDRGACVSAEDSSALLDAMRSGQEETVALLEAKGANEPTLKQLKDALVEVRGDPYRPFRETAIQMLLDRGADGSAADSET